MVSTRLMSVVNGGNESSVAQNSTDSVRCTRNSTSAATSTTATTSNEQPSTNKQTTVSTKTSLKLLDLPPEIVQKILSNLTFKNVCQLRLVSKCSFKNWI